MLSRRYFICVLFWAETEAVRLDARMKDSREFKREFVNERFCEAMRAVRIVRSCWSLDTSPSIVRSLVSSSLTTSFVISRTVWVSRTTSLIGVVVALDT